MSRIAYCNGRYTALNTPAIFIEDRGYQFADGIYEVCLVQRGQFIDEDLHLTRLQKSLEFVDIKLPVTLKTLRFIMRETVRRNHLHYAKVYIQVTRGIASAKIGRDHAGEPNMRAHLTVTARPIDINKHFGLSDKKIKVITLPDDRWAHCHIKSLGLLPNILARRMAHAQGVDDAWLVDEAGFITEATSANIWIVDKHGVLRTHQADQKILGGITRHALFTICEGLQIKVSEEPFRIEDVLSARECFSTASTMIITPVICVNGTKIADGQTGIYAKKLADAYSDYAEYGEEKWKKLIKS